MQAPTLQELAPAGHDLAADPHSVYAALRATGPVHRVHVPDSGDAWLVLGHAEARTALGDPRLRNDIRHSATWQDDGGHAVGRNMLQTDPPRHTRLRRTVAGHFTPGRVASYRPGIEDIAVRLVDAFAGDGRVDVVSRYALPLPVMVICDLLGVPQDDRDTFHAWSRELVAPTSRTAAGEASAALAGYLAGLIRRAPGAPGSSLLGELAGDAHDRLGAEEILGMAFLLLVAGHETTVSLISGTLHGLLTHPAQLAQVYADPALIGRAVEESLRFHTPVHASAFRFAADPLDLGGTRIAAGDSVIVSLAAASRDPLRFADPDRFDLHREPGGHLAFGHGLHHCLGAPLARAETEIALRVLLERHPALGLAADPAPLVWRTGTLLRGLVRLPLDLG
ncbi:cytochrome P450 family protein [Streptomyces subrutilus]|uniref:cytochrome P450 family protein n=1 Tax=Streptomyces subrutilus TaxID=36818 RepID=UPI0033EEF8E3